MASKGVKPSLPGRSTIDRHRKKSPNSFCSSGSHFIQCRTQCRQGTDCIGKTVGLREQSYDLAMIIDHTEEGLVCALAIQQLDT